MIGIIGLGKLGSAFAQGFLNAGVKIFAYDPSAEKLSLKGIHKASSPKDAMGKSNIVLLALKPDTLLTILKENAEAAKGKLLVSPAANLALSEMEAAAPTLKIIRIMPNIAASENLSPIPYILGKNITSEDENSFLELFSILGAPAKVKEEHLNIITAIAGSSPAYFAYFARAMREAAKEAGVPEKTANLFLAQALSGPGALLSKSSCEEVMEKVTTKGGVTEKGIKELESAGVYQAIKHAIKFQSKK